MNTQETKMKTKMILAVLAAVCVLSVGSVSANEIEFSLVGTAPMPQSSLYSAQVMNLAAPMSGSPVASPAPAPSSSLPINIVRPQGFGDGRLEKGFFTASIGAMIALNVADYITTRQALKYSGLSEGNPLMKPFVKNPYVFAAVKGGITVLSVWGMNKLFKRDRKMAWVMTTVSNFLLSYVVANNMRLVSRMRPR